MRREGEDGRHEVRFTITVVVIVVSLTTGDGEGKMVSSSDEDGRTGMGLENDCVSRVELEMEEGVFVGAMDERHATSLEEEWRA